MFGECHAHIFMNGSDYHEAVRRNEKKPDEGWIRRVLAAYRDADVTFIREGGDHYGVSALARKLAPEYGITYLTSGFGIFKEGYYGRVVGLPFRTMKEYADLVLRVRREGGDFIKIMTTGIMTFTSPEGLTGHALPREEVFEMVHIAHEEGFKVMSHTNGADAVIDAVEAGVDSVEHGNFQNEESLLCLSEHAAQTVWVPTLVTVRNLIGDGRFPDDVLKEIYEGNVRKVRRARELGVQMALGSDAGAYRVPHVKGIRDEWQTFQQIFPGDDSLTSYLEAGEQKIRNFVREN